MLEVVRVVELEPLPVSSGGEPAHPLRFRIEVLNELGSRRRFYARLYRWESFEQYDALVVDRFWDWQANPADSAEAALQALLSTLKHQLPPLHTEAAEPPTIAPASSIQQAVRELIDLAAPYVALAEQFRVTVDALPPRRDFGPEVLLTHEDVMRGLRLYVSGAISAEHLSSWASLLEMNQFVEYAEEKHGAISEVLFLLASPDINEPITPDVCGRLLRKLSSE
jgi:hypothetical protein